MFLKKALKIKKMQVVRIINQYYKHIIIFVVFQKKTKWLMKH